VSDDGKTIKLDKIAGQPIPMTFEKEATS